MFDLTRLAPRCAAAAVYLAATLVATPGGAAEPDRDSDVFTVADVHVDESAEAAANARTLALAHGERRAFDLLMRRLTVRADRDRLPRPAAEAISGMVQDIAIANEKNSRVRYIADVTYRFKPQAIRSLMRANHIRYAETRSKPTLVLPLFETAGTLALWENPNPWRAAWQAAAPSAGGLVPLVIPAGGLSDVADIGASSAANGDAERLSAIARRYGAGAAIVARAVLGLDRDGRSELSISAETYGSAEREQTFVTTILAQSGETTEQLLERARAETVELIQDNWKKANLIQFEQNSVLVAEMPLASLREWVEAQKRLKSVALVQKVDLVLMSRGEARFNVFYLGDAAQLRLALAQKDLILTEGEGAWTVRIDPRAGISPANAAVK